MVAVHSSGSGQPRPRVVALLVVGALAAASIFGAQLLVGRSTPHGRPPSATGTPAGGSAGDSPDGSGSGEPPLQIMAQPGATPQDIGEGLHTGLFQHVMYYYRKSRGPDEGEGDDGYGGAYMFPELTAKLVEIVQRPHVHTVCETGFGVGHSAALALHTKPSTHVYSWDMMDIDSKQWSRDQLDSMFPGRLTMVDGDTQVNVRKFFAEHPEVYCDVVFPDEGQEKLEINSLEAMLTRAHCGSVIVMDWGLVDGTPAYNEAHRSAAWEVAKSRGLIEEVECLLAKPHKVYHTRRNILSRMCIGRVLNCRAAPPRVAAKPSVTCEPDMWAAAVFRGRSPYDLHRVSPVFDASFPSDIKAQYVADPMLLQHPTVGGATWTMFFEVWRSDAPDAVIGAAVSSDLRTWTYVGAVDIPWGGHLAFPYAFEHEGEVYMLPNNAHADGATELHLYRAVEYPLRWERLGKVLEADTPIIDAVLFEHGDGSAAAWYMLWSTPLSDTMRLHVSTSGMRGPFTEHPKSPLLTSRRDLSRAAGRMSVRDGRLFRYAQDCTFRYGRRVYEVEIMELTPTTYLEAGSRTAMMEPSGWPGWDAKAMHTFDLHPDGAGGWVASVDGAMGC